VSQQAERVQVPTLHTTGWYDTNLGPCLEAFCTLQALDEQHGRSGRRRLVIGFWGHGTPSRLVEGHLEKVEPKARLDATVGTLHGFLDRWVRGNEPQGEPDAPISLFVMGLNEWRDEWEWPLARAEEASFFLHSDGGANTLDGDGRLSREAPADEAADAFRHDPADPVPAWGGQLTTMLAIPGPGPFDQREFEARDDVLVFTSEPMADEYEITGPVRLELWASSSAVDADFVAKLLDVFPDGRVINLCEGIVRAGFVEPPVTPLDPDVPVCFTIDLGAMSNVFLTGHRIRLEVASSSFPTWDVNLGTGSYLFDDTTGKAEVAEQRVFHDEEHPSRLVLPHVPSPGWM
jgi:putative CocE/NonD family hydrolase